MEGKMKSTKYLKILLVLLIIVSLIPVSVLGYSSNPTVSIWTDKTTYCIGDTVNVYFRVNYGSNTYAYVDIIDYGTGGKTTYLRNTSKIKTNTTYHDTGIVGGPTGTEKLKIIGKISNSSSSSTCSFKINNCSNNNNTNINNKSNAPTNKYNSGFSSTDDVIYTAKNSDRSINSLSIGQINTGAGYLMQANILKAPAGVGGFIIDMASCLQDKGLYDGIVYYSVKNNNTSVGILLVGDRKEATNIWNYVRCIGSYATGIPMDITTKTLTYCQWTIDDRYDVIYIAYTASNNPVYNNIKNSLNCCPSCCKTIYKK